MWDQFLMLGVVLFFVASAGLATVFEGLREGGK